MTVIAALIRDLSAADHRPTAALRKALEHPAEIAEATLPLLEAAGVGRDLSPQDLNLLFWGLHVMAQARDSRALPPLLALLRQDMDLIDAVLGDATTSTLARVLASLFDGDTEPLFRLALDSSLDDAVRQAVLAACTFLCVDGRIDREAMRTLLVRFDDAKAAVEGEMSWSAWEEAVAQLGLRDLAPRVEAAQADGRIDPTISEPEWFHETLRAVERHPDDRTRLDAWQHGYLDDPVAALEWTRESYGKPQRNPLKAIGRNDPCPCGSGKKFKKCCLGREATEAPWVPLPGLS